MIGTPNRMASASVELRVVHRGDAGFAEQAMVVAGPRRPRNTGS